MHAIEMQTISQEFARCWQAAGRHLNGRVQGSIHFWLKANLTPPFLEHLSFRLGNQLFFIRIADVARRLSVPGSLGGLLMIAEGCNGRACLMPMRLRAGAWSPATPGWGLVEARTGGLIDPVALVSDARIEMTDWELQDFAVQIVRQQLEAEGRRLMSWQGNPAVDPSLWYVGDDGPEWVVVRAARYPEKRAVPPANWSAIADQCAALGKRGNFASVAVASADDSFDPAAPATPLWRGHELVVRYHGLEPIAGLA